MKANPFEVPTTLPAKERAEAHAEHARALLSAADIDPRRSELYSTRAVAHATLAVYWQGEARS